MVAGRIVLLLVILKLPGAGVYLPASELAFDGLIWGTAEEYCDARLERCRAFMPVPGVLQTIHRAEFWGAILPMQAHWPCHLGVDKTSMLPGQLVGCWTVTAWLSLCLVVKDGDLVALAHCT